MRKFNTAMVVLVLTLLGVSACADLEVTNPNDPNREKVLQSSGDVESLIAGGFNTWWGGTNHWSNVLWASVASFQSMTTAANAGNIDHSQIPRAPIMNNTAYDDFGSVVERTWQRSYRALAAVSDGLRTLQERPELAEELGATQAERLQAFAKYIQGLSHATLALWYDQAYILDENTDLSGELTSVPYTDVMDAAMGYFDDAIAIADAGDFSIPASWHMNQMDAATFADLMHTFKAVFRASTPRTADETVDWTAVLTDLNAGLTDTYMVTADPFNGWYNGAHDIVGGPNGWGSSHYFILGMADQSGNYQQWLADPVQDRYPWFGTNQDEDPFLIHTPDTRFPTGATIQEQIDNPGDYYVIPTDDTYSYGYVEHMDNPGRGTWRWTYYYRPTSYLYWFYVDFEIPLVTKQEIDLLRAEALLESGGATGAASAATIINQTRTAHGLAGTDATGTNTDCVPKLPDGSCGDLMEMLKWEKRLETQGYGMLMRLSWFWDARRWGDHYKGTPLQWPIPASDLQVLQLPIYTFGGVNDTPPGASAGSSYAWPGE